MRRILIVMILTCTWGGAASAQIPPEEPVCKADRSGNVLVTTIQYGDGYRIEGPWRIHSANSRRGIAQVTATLDHIVETDPFTRKRQLTPLPGAVEMTFQGRNGHQLLEQAANVWCATIAQALAARPIESLQRLSDNRLVM